MDFNHHTLSNGIRLIHLHADTPVAHCGILINAGTRDEKENEQGMAHFIEHVIFKGTQKRNVYQILNRLDNVGADLNAYTTKEETCIHASFLNIWYDRALELIADITFNSTFPDKEIEKEKDVIIDEINSYKDNPSEKIFDDFEEIIFTGHPIGRNILGTARQIRRFRKPDIRQFILNNYHTDEMVISSVGSIDFRKLVRIVEKYFSVISENSRLMSRSPFLNYYPRYKSVRKKTFQTHCMIGGIAYAYNDPRRFGMALLNNILGGPGMNSRLNLSVRERHGLAYTVESSYNAYSDTGIFSIYTGLDNGTLDKTVELIHRELRKLREQPLGPGQLRTAKQQLTGQLAVAYESNLNKMLSMGKSMLMSNRVLSLQEINEKIENVTSEQLAEIAREVFDPLMLSMLSYLSEKHKP
ncbi:MAG: pitrilysin family protein [Bacteroidetes bacterium]|nr:pitrilysin family protein [Bacteroidota bacterium]